MALKITSTWKKYKKLQTSLPFLSNLGPFYQHKTMQMHPNPWCLWKAFEWYDMQLPWSCTWSSTRSYDRAKSWLCWWRNVAYQTSKRDFKSHALLQSLNILEHVLALFPSAYLLFSLFSTDEDLSFGSRWDLVINVQSSWGLRTSGL